MPPFRTYVILLSIAALSIAFFLYKFFDLNMDVLIPSMVVLIFLLALRDVRILLVGWYLVAPYVVQLGGVGLPNYASNFGHNYLVPVIAVISLAVFILRGKRIAFGKEDVVILLFIAYGGFSLLFIGKGEYNDMRWLYFVYVLPFLVYSIAKNIEIDSQLIKMLGYVAVFHVVQAVLLCAYNVVYAKNLYPPELKWLDVGAFGRQVGPVGNPIIFGLLLQVTFSFLFLAHRYGYVPKLVFRSLLVPLFIMTLLTFTRSVWVGAFITFMYLTYKTSERAGAKIFRVAVLTVVTFGLLYTVLALSPDVKGRFEEEQTANFRIVMAQASLKLIAANPVFGAGQGKFDEAVERYLFDARGVYNTRETSHVTLLTILAELGIIGGALWVAFILMNLIPAMRMGDLPPEDQFIVAVFASNAIFFLVNAFLIDMRWSLIGYALMFVSLGLARNICNENRMKMQLT